jgi:hypothetical protein
VHPAQQHGRLFPSKSSELTRFTCCFLVSDFLTDTTQQIHSFRASGVMSSQALKVFSDDKIAFFKSSGILCTAPEEICFFI